MRVRYMDVLCTTAVSYGTMMVYIRYVLRSTVLTRILRGGALSKDHTCNDIRATPARRTRLARRDDQCFDGCVPAPPLSTHKRITRRRWYAVNGETVLIDRLPAFNKDTITPHFILKTYYKYVVFLWPYRRGGGRATFSLVRIIFGDVFFCNFFALVCSLHLIHV